MEDFTAIEAQFEAQKIAFAPFVFQATNSLIDLGILKYIYDSKEGVTTQDIVQGTGVSEYGVEVLLDLAVFSKIVFLKEGKYVAGKVAYFLLKDKLTEVNRKFTEDICYEGAAYLTDSIKNGKPEGLRVLGDWDTLYEGLQLLPPGIKESWFDFDHYYSDTSFDSALKIAFSSKPKRLIDIGGNTGKWSRKCVAFDKEVSVTIVDLPGQINAAKKNALTAEGGDRISFYPQDMLKFDAKVPSDGDVYWMSQFLDCFSKAEIIHILKTVCSSMKEGSEVIIMETFVDRQKYPAAEFSLHCTSLYFTCMANGNSRMYALDPFVECVEAAGLKVKELIDSVGVSHSILKCVKA